MNLEYYEPELYKVTSTTVSVRMAPTPGGSWVREEDIAALEDENRALRTEVDRLKAPPKMLSAEEVTEPGWYWFKFGTGHLTLASVIFMSGELVMRTFAGNYITPKTGKFFGPLNLTPPEV